LQVQQLMQMQMQQRQGRVSNNPRASAAKLVALLLEATLCSMQPNLNRLESGVWYPTDVEIFIINLHI
jgi:hypothetical protein